MSRYDLQAFEQDADYFDPLRLLVAVKSFDLQAIRRRYLESRRRNRAGSVERRPPSPGGLVDVTIEDGRIVDWRIVAELMEARSISGHNEQLAMSSENEVYLFDGDARAPRVIRHPWLSYIHTVRWNDDSSRLLVSSSGVDTLLEFDARTLEPAWEWNAWEHGLNRGTDPRTGERHVLTRSPDEADALRRKGENVVLVRNPADEPLPTALRAAFMNSAEYDRNGRILATLFHDGKIVRIDRHSGAYDTVLDGLSKPHGGMAFRQGYLATDTGGGRVVVEEDGEASEYDFSRLPGKPEAMRDLEWLQTSRPVTDTVLLTVDSNRTVFVCFDIEQQKCMIVPYDPDWAVQDVLRLPAASEDALERAHRWFATR